MHSDISTLFDGLRFPEGCRWHEGQLWFSDMHTGRLYSASLETGELRVEFTVEGAQLSGIGWLPDGTLVVSSMLDRLVLRRRPGGDVEVHADLSSITPFPINDLIVDRSGRIIVGGFGYDLYGGASERPGPLIGVSDGTPTMLATDLIFPNGMALLSDNTLIVAETWAARLSAFDITPTGQLENRRVWAELPAGSTPDGICNDLDDGIWVSSIANGMFLRVTEGGEVTNTVEIEDRLAVDCALGGAEGRTLLMSTANSWQPSETLVCAGRIEQLRL